MLVGTWPGCAGEVKCMPGHTGETRARRPWRGRGGRLGDLVLLIGPALDWAVWAQLLGLAVGLF